MVSKIYINSLCHEPETLMPKTDRNSLGICTNMLCRNRWSLETGGL